jgi:hypothetical protein
MWLISLLNTEDKANRRCFRKKMKLFCDITNDYAFKRLNKQITAISASVQTL